MVLSAFGVQFLHLYGTSIYLSLRQIERSVQLYKPQFELAKKIESQSPDNTRLLVDNIPACWINRREHSKELHSWFDVPMRSQIRMFAQWIRDNNVWAVLALRRLDDGPF